MTSKLPLTLLTGFLGSGKSTLLTQILKDPAFANAAIIVNEFGEVGLDDFFVTHSKEQVLRMTTGCLCCTVRGDISDTLMDLWHKRKNGDIPTFERIIVETTGLADPAPVIHTLMSEQSIAARFRLESVITTVDAVNGLQTFALHEECIKQVAVADQIILTKTDLDTANTKLDELHKELMRLNPTATRLERHAPEFDLKQILGQGLFDPKTKSPDLQNWLRLEAVDHEHEHHHHDHHHHDVNKHSETIETFAILIEEPVSGHEFIGKLQSLVKRYGQKLLRIKGVANLKERNNKPYIIHGVQHVFHEPIELETWPDNDHRTKLVFITSDLDQELVKNVFAKWM